MTEGPRFLKEHDRIPTEGLRGQHGRYLPPPGLVQAANTALGLGIPLLLTGAPGTGKSDFAWVASQALSGTPPLRCQIRSTTTARELLYHYDALVRFTDAQSGDAGKRRARDPRHYVRLRPLGIALTSRDPDTPPVVLLDEIDKAPRDLPNDLLWELDEGHFEIPEIGDREEAPSDVVEDPAHDGTPLKRVMKRDSRARKPFVVITSNSERQLPDAFLRRCAFFHIPSPQPEDLIRIAEARVEGSDVPPPPQVLRQLMTVFTALRKEIPTKKSTTAEMLQWVDALTRLYDPEDLRDTLDAFETALKRQERPPWHTLPGLSCLVKLREDLEHFMPPPEPEPDASPAS